MRKDPVVAGWQLERRRSQRGAWVGEGAEPTGAGLRAGGAGPEVRMTLDSLPAGSGGGGTRGRRRECIPPAGKRLRSGRWRVRAVCRFRRRRADDDSASIPLPPPDGWPLYGPASRCRCSIPDHWPNLLHWRTEGISFFSLIPSASASASAIPQFRNSQFPKFRNQSAHHQPPSSTQKPTTADVSKCGWASGRNRSGVTFSVILQRRLADRN